MRKYFVLLIAFLSCIICFAQEKFPYPINSTASERNPVMLPDSSIMLASDRKEEGLYKCYRFEYENGEWVSSPSYLTSLINSLVFSQGELFFQFSEDYTYITVTHQSAITGNRFFEGKLVNGEWDFFNEILKDEVNPIWHAVSLSSDNSRLYGKSPTGELYNFTKSDNDWKNIERLDVFDGVLDKVDQPIAIGTNGLLVVGSFKKTSKKEMTGWFYSKRSADDKWIAPIHIIDFGGFDISISPWKDKVLFSDFVDVGIMDSPQMLGQVIENSVKDLTKSKQKDNKSENKSESLSNPIGNPKYYALLMGVSDYQFNNIDLVDLEHPVGDATLLGEVLISNYTFKKENVSVLHNPSRAEIIDALEQISEKINERDNLLIFYAGHGVFNKELNMGYWLPSDAKSSSKANWILNSTVKDYIAGINTKHTLLISDACFSGSIFKTRDVTSSLDDFGFSRIYRMPSRKAMTSGTLNTVPDKSVFMEFLIKRLKENDREYLPSKWLFYEIENAVINNTSNIPQFGTLQNSGDEGGDFIFIRKSSK